MLIVKRESNGGIKSCHIHGLLRDLAISKAKDSKNFEGGHGLRLPESIGRLVNLQTLDCRFGKIPWSVWRLHQLRHLYGHYSTVLSRPMMSRCLTFNGDLSELLTNLQTLKLAPGPWLENGLGKLPQLKKLRIKEDPMLTLKKLPNLRILKLMGNSCGSKMVCSFGGFFQLEVLGLHWLKKLEELKVEEGALPKLRTLQIRGRKMKKVPQGYCNWKNFRN
ncbi:putative disease resistance protein RF9 [Vitis vinifera]|uniref:Putative disease resistance protein RF9 n=1 Tax=Vitis vinifera TaxID=29760 RepID=A0A438I1M8_VITVI|nr:putative disease resistance protein RF9 [Vitis vinifera]